MHAGRFINIDPLVCKDARTPPAPRMHKRTRQDTYLQIDGARLVDIDSLVEVVYLVGEGVQILGLRFRGSGFEVRV